MKKNMVGPAIMALLYVFVILGGFAWAIYCSYIRD